MISMTRSILVIAYLLFYIIVSQFLIVHYHIVKFWIDSSKFINCKNSKLLY